MSWASEISDSLRTALQPSGARIVATGATADGERHWQVDPSSKGNERFEIGSITKTMTGIVLARLVLEGSVALDTPIETWLDAGENASITLEELATHTSGLPRLAPNFEDHADFDPANPYASYTSGMAEAALRSVTRNGARSYAYDYSNFGFQVLGMCLERVSGRPLADLFREFIFDPAGMSAATVDPDASVLQGEPEEGPVPNWTLLLHGPGGVNATIADMVAYLEFVLHPPEGRVGDAIRLALQPRADGAGARIGLGWALHPAGIACCGGATAGFSSYVAAHLADGRAVAVMMNRPASDAIQAAALAAALGQNPADLVPVPVDGDTTPWTEAALEFFGCFDRHDFDGARSKMRPTTAESLTVDRLSAAWIQVTGGCGSLSEPAVTGVARVNGAVQVTLVAEGSTKPLTMRAWLDDERTFVGVTIH